MDSRDLGMLWSLRDSIQPKKKQKLAEAYPPYFSFYLAPMPLAGVYKLVWFGPYTRFTLFSFLSALIVFHPQLSFIPFIYLPLSFVNLSICTSIIMLRFVHTRLFFLGQLVRTTYTRTRNRSRLGYRRFNMLHHLFLNSLSPARTCITYIIPMHHSLSRTILYHRYSYMLSWTIIYYNIHVAVWAGNTRWICEIHG
jgi:hypothetical protein